jgi:hypothetical protein
MLAAVTRLNAQIRELAPVLNSPTIMGEPTVKSVNPEIPVDTMMKRYRGATYIFAVGMRDGETKASFTIKGAGGSNAEVLGEGRNITRQQGIFEDDFKPLDVHIYRIR